MRIKKMLAVGACTAVFALCASPATLAFADYSLDWAMLPNAKSNYVAKTETLTENGQTVKTTYTVKNKKVRKKVAKAKGVKTVWTYKYKGSRIVSEKIVITCNGTTETQKISFTYRKNGYLKSAKGESDLDDIFRATFDKKGRMAELRTAFLSDELDETIYTYTYKTSKGRIAEKKCDVWWAGDGRSREDSTDHEKYTYKYNSKGDITKVVDKYTSWQGDEFAYKHTIKVKCSYDKKKHLTKEKRYLDGAPTQTVKYSRFAKIKADKTGAINQIIHSGLLRGIPKSVYEWKA